MRSRRWTETDLRNGAKKATSLRQLLIVLGLRETGGNYKQINKYLKEYIIDTSHFTGRAWNKGRKIPSTRRFNLSDILVSSSNYQSYKLKKRLFQEGLKLSACESCGWATKASDGRIPLELHHINGVSNDNRLENLQILCPNCHSLKSSHRGKNIKK